MELTEIQKKLLAISKPRNKEVIERAKKRKGKLKRERKLNMTTEDKAKAYGEAGGTFYKKSNETKESEDERIRKNCIHFLELQKSHHASTVEIEECIAWLEKPGQKETVWNKEDEENMNNVLYILNQLEYTSYEEDDIAEKAINWFKSLKDRLCSNNEYDKDMLGAIAYCIKNNRPLEKEHIVWLEKQDNYNGLVEKAKAYNEAHMQDVRERAAIAALSGTLSDPNTVGNFEQFADVAVGYADALIERLKKK